MERTWMRLKPEAMHDNTTPPILFDELTREILSWLPVKSLVRFMCVSKSFQSFITDPSFVKLHIQRSPKNVHFLLNYSHDTLGRAFILPCPVGSLSANPLSLVADDHGLGYDLNDKYEVVGSCNGLVCLVAQFNTGSMDVCMFRVWNPATRKIFEDPQCILVLHGTDDRVSACAFGYDNLSDTYKVVSVASTLDSNHGSLKSCDVRVCNISDNNCWRNIQSFPADPTTILCCAVYLNGTLNWLASTHNMDDLGVTFDELVIVSLDLGNETYTQLLLPRGLDGVRLRDFLFHFKDVFNSNKGFGVLKDCLSLFLTNYRTNQFSIWQMKEFGDQKSWTRSLNIAIMDFPIDCMPLGDLRPLIMFKDGSVLMIDATYPSRTVLYNGRDDTLECSPISCNTNWIYANDYVQSLVSPRRY